MSQLNTTPEGFRTAAYLAARARLDAARSRSGKTSRSVDCNPPNVRCGGRCIPPSWDCRLKGEGPDPHLRAVKTDPLSGFANIQRGLGRITKGVTRGNFSEVEGGKRAIIRGVVKTVPGDIQQKKQLQKTLENRTRAIGIGLAVVTGGLGMHAILMKSNTFGYRQGLGRNINQATRAGVSSVLDSIPVLGAQRAATRAAVGANLGSAAARASVPAPNVGAIPGTTVLSATDRDSHSALQQSLNRINGATRSGAAGTSGNLENWNQRHNSAFWNATRKSDITGVGAPARVSIYAEPSAQEYLGNQFGVPPGDRSSRASVKAALQARFDEERRGLVSLAQQQGLRVRRGPNGDTIDSKDINAFVSGVVRSRPIADTAVRQSVEAHVRSVLTKAPSNYTNEVYNASVLSFDNFYKDTARDIRSIPGAAATGRRIATPLTEGSNELLRNTNTYRSTYLAGELRARTQMAGPAHSELVQAAYYHTRVVGTNASSYEIPDRLAFNAASELSGRSITSRSEAIGIITRETGFSGARVAGAAAPRQRGASAQASLSTLARSIKARAGNESMSMEAALRQARTELGNRGDSADLPPRVAAYLQMRNDFVAGKKGLGKPCGESHIPKAHECNIGKGKVAPPEAGKRFNTGAKVAVAAAAASAVIGVTALTASPKLKQRARVQSRLIARGSDKTLKQALMLGGRGTVAGLSSKQVKAGLSKLPTQLQEPARQLVGMAKQGAAGMALKAEGFTIQDIDVVNNFSTWKNKQGSIISIGSYGDSLVTYASSKSHTWNKKSVYKIGFNVDQSFDATRTIPAEQARSITGAVRRMTDNHLSKINDGILATFPWDGDDYGAKRRAIYTRAGFNNIVGEESQWALVEKGRIRKMNSSQSFLYLAESTERDAPIYKPTKAQRKDAAGEKGLGKPCGASHIPKTYECSKGAAGSSSAGNNKTAIIAAVVGGAVAIGVAGAVAYNVKTISDPTKTPLAASPNIRDVVKAAKAETGTKSASEAMGHYYVNKSGLKPGDVVYFRSEKDPSAHFGVYLGPGKDGIVRAVIANTKASRFSWSDVTEIGSIKPGVKAAQAVMTPLVKAPTPQFLQGGKGPYTPEEVMRRAIRISNTDYKFSVTRNNCETLANTIAYGVPKSEQLDRFNRASRVMVDVTVGRGQRGEGERAIYEGRAQGRSYTAADFAKFLEGKRAFSSPEGKNLARQYDSYFKGYNLDARNAPDYLGLISPSELWSSINTYEAPVRAQAMSNYLFALRTLKEMAAS